MLKGIHLTLMIGPAVPLPVPRALIDALTSVSVTTPTEGPSVFQVQFTLSNRSPLQTLFLVAGGSSIPLRGAGSAAIAEAPSLTHSRAPWYA